MSWAKIPYYTES